MQVPSRCAALSLRLGEPLVGSAPRTRGWLLVEHAGPWGPRGFTDSGLPDEVVDEVARRADEAGVRIQLIRRHAVRHDSPCTAVILAHSAPQGLWIRRGEVGTPHDLMGIPVGAAAGADPPDWGEAAATPVMLVCTHGRRDACCAELGRAVAARLATVDDIDVWETTHTGGHRFAANLVVLPGGWVYGRVTGDRSHEVVAAHREGRVVTDLLRGRSCYDPWGQVAELSVRRDTGIMEAVDVEVVEVVPGGPDAARVRVSLPGRTATVELERRPTGLPRPVSCGDEKQKDPGIIEVRDLRYS